ncbi:MAG: tripartite tricarboxylate transporter substrate binding protein [Betaproteobacteria bacterium]
MFKRILGSLALAATGALSLTALAQDYPAAPIRVVIPYAPGGGSDILARPVGVYIEGALKQPVVIDNKGGAGGNIGSEFVARSAPNGYTLLLANNSQVINQFVYKRPGYDMEKDFAPISLLGTSPTVVVVNKSLPVNSIRELIEYAQKNEGKLNFSSAGVGTPGHLAGLLFNKQAGLNIVHVAYKGTGPAILALLQNEVQVHFATPAAADPHVKSGEFKALAVTSQGRFAQLPNLPTVAESGVPSLRDYHIDVWWGLLAPAGTSASILEKLNASVAAALRDPKLRDSWLSRGMVPTSNSVVAFQSLIRSDLQKWEKLVRDNDIKVD